MNKARTNANTIIFLRQRIRHGPEEAKDRATCRICRPLLLHLNQADLQEPGAQTPLIRASEEATWLEASL
jgi:hypothetical protein